MKLAIVIIVGLATAAQSQPVQIDRTPCDTLTLHMRDASLLRADLALYLDGILAGAAAVVGPRVGADALEDAIEAACLADRRSAITVVVRRAVETLTAD